MSNTSTETLGFGPVEEFVDIAITDRATLEILEKQLTRPDPDGEKGSRLPRKNGGDSWAGS